MTPIYTLAVILGAALSVYTFITFRRQKKAALIQLRHGSKVAQTALGPIEYASVGKGPPVLILHGGGGGYDQGLLFAIPEWGYKFISVSRPGHLRTPLSSGVSFAQQADLFAAFLDHLDLPEAIIFGASAGGPSAIQFALRHPDRITALVLISAINQSLTVFSANINIAEKLIPLGDFPLWLITNTPLRALFDVAGVTKNVGTTPQKKVLLKQLIDSIFPISLRAPGSLSDYEYIQAIDKYPLNKIAAPTLVIHGEGDSIVSFQQGLIAAQTIPNTEFLPIPNADHLAIISHLEIVQPVLKKFLAKHSPNLSNT